MDIIFISENADIELPEESFIWLYSSESEFSKKEYFFFVFFSVKNPLLSSSFISFIFLIYSKHILSVFNYGLKNWLNILISVE